MDYFNHNERVKQKQFSEFRDRLFHFVILFFVNRNVSKNTVSFIGVGFLILACVLDPYQYWWGVVVGLFLYLFFDAIDGGVARYTNTASENGSVVDIICDQLGVVLLTASSIYYYDTNSIIALLYANSYIGFVVLVVYLNQQNIKMIPFLRVKYVFYAVYTISPFVGIIVIDVFISIFCIYYILNFLFFIKYLM